jgi:hypothetical protein
MGVLQFFETSGNIRPQKNSVVFEGIIPEKVVFIGFIFLYLGKVHYLFSITKILLHFEQTVKNETTIWDLFPFVILKLTYKNSPHAKILST